MDVVVVGASGTIGAAVSAALVDRGNRVWRASRSGECRVDLERPESIERLVAGLPELDAVVCCAASGGLTLVDQGDDAEFTRGLGGKLLGQVRLVRAVIPRLRDGGSITLTGGTFGEPLRGASFGALINAGLAAFTAAAALELPRGLRINLVAPGWVSETLARMGTMGSSAGPSARGVAAAEVARAYVRSIEDGGLTGETLVVVRQT